MLDFLTLLFEEGTQYSGLNTARSALSAIIMLPGNTPVGQHPLVCRFLRGVFQERPALPRYNTTWDVSLVLAYLQKLYPLEEITLKQLSQKLVMLIALLSGQRTQTLAVIDIDCIRWKDDGCLVYISSPLKHTRPGVHQEPIKLSPYTDQRLCVIKTLCAYLQKTKLCRGSETRLFISYQKPYGAVSSDTVRRWIKTVMDAAGVDTSLFKPQSTRAASTSAAKAAGVSVDEILIQAGWSNCATFKTFYNKPVAKEQCFAEAILKTIS